ncbi:MAG: GDSL-type esterase/lipase family protein [Pyrinomonadaceae bacterium]
MNHFRALNRIFVGFILISIGLSGTAARVNAKGIENAANLAPFFRKLDALKRKMVVEPVRIAHFGDSHVAADILTADIRHRFQADFGDGGNGYMIARNPFSTPRRGVTSGTSSGWTINGIGKGAGNDGAYGMAGISMSTDSANEKMWLESNTNHFEVYVLKGPGGGKINITLDGASYLDGPMSLQAATPTVEMVPIDSPMMANHRIEIVTLSKGQTRILGIASEQITNGSGICYDVLGINGARVSRISGWNQKVLVDTMKYRLPDLIIVAYGTNEVTDKDWTIESYAKMMAGIIKMFKAAAPGASVIVFGPPDRADNDDATTRMPAMLEAQRRAAKEAGAAFWCSFDAMGGPGSMDTWITQGLGQGDHVHLTSAGYQRIGDMFYDDISAAFKEWKSHNTNTRTRRAE